MISKRIEELLFPENYVTLGAQMDGRRILVMGYSNNCLLYTSDAADDL
jgi:hypothetical protein